MTKEEIIWQLESLVDNSESFKEDDEPDSIWHKDIIALKYAIALIEKEPTAPKQVDSIEK